MRQTTITVSYARTHSLGNYSNVKPSIALTAELDEGDDPAAARAELLAQARAFVEDRIDEALEGDGEAARFSAAPRYRIITVADRWVGFHDRRLIPPEKLVIILPNEASLPASGPETWHTDIHSPARKLRLGHAQRRVWEWLEGKDGFRVIDCSDGDLSRLPAWVLEGPPREEPVASPDESPAHFDVDPDEGVA